MTRRKLTLLPDLTEQQFQAQVVDLAAMCGVQAMHVRRCRVRDDRHATPTSIPGWPDLVLWSPHTGVVFAELKSGRGRVSADQRAVLASLDAAGGVTAVWRPDDFDSIRRLLDPRSTT